MNFRTELSSETDLHTFDDLIHEKDYTTEPWGKDGLFKELCCQ